MHEWKQVLSKAAGFQLPAEEPIVAAKEAKEEREVIADKTERLQKRKTQKVVMVEEPKVEIEPQEEVEIVESLFDAPPSPAKSAEAR